MASDSNSSEPLFRFHLYTKGGHHVVIDNITEFKSTSLGGYTWKAHRTATTKILTFDPSDIEVITYEVMGQYDPELEEQNNSG